MKFWRRGHESSASGGVRPDLPAEVAAEVEAQIRRRLGSQVSDLRVVVRGDGLTLQGQARTQYARQLAQHIAMEATALPIVANEIRV